MTTISQKIIDHYKNPLNFGRLKNFTHSAEGSDASCGDQIKIQLNVENGKVKEIRFQGEGCALCIGVCSMLTEKVKGMALEKIKRLDDNLLRQLAGKISPGRGKCVQLPLTVLKKAVV